jgi:hypothetical protein
MRRISVILDEISEKAVEDIIAKNKCSISDAVNAALLAYSMDNQPSMFIDQGPLVKVTEAVAKTEWGTVENWCHHRSIDKNRLKYLIKRCESGSTVWGFGNTKNKWRDKQDDREFKTHTSWIAHCLKEDLNIIL